MAQGKNIRKYFICIVAMILLLVFAALGPQLLFMTQDKHVQGKVSVGERDRMDLSVLHAGYTKLLRERLENYAEGILEERQYYTAVTECKKDAECYSILEKVLNREWSAFLNDVGILPHYIYASMQTGYTVEEWKRYVIYDTELENGVAIMVWYFLISIDENVQMKLLVDVEDDTVYQVQIITADESYYDLPALYIPYEDLVTVVPLYWFYYYDAGVTEEMLESMGYDLDSEKKDKFSEYDKMNSFITYNLAGESGVTLEENYLEMRKELLYEECFLHWKLRIEQEPDTKKCRISIGITDIAELIPEFSAN